MSLRSSVVAATLAIVVSASAHAQCGVERWSIKTGTDSGAFSINLSSYVSSTIYNFHQSTRPSTIPSNSRVAPRETTQYQLGGTLIKYVKESDKDYHLVIKDGAGRTMIIEIPDPNCVSGSAFGTGISRARGQFDARFTATTTMKSTTTPVTIKGIGFWDYLHGQTGVAPNGIEVHPVLNITFGAADELAPGVSADSINEDGEIVEVIPAGFVRDDDGGLVQVFRGGEAVPESVLHHGGAVLEDPSIHVIRVGDAPRKRGGDVMQAAREFSSAERLRVLDRYGVRATGLRVSGMRIAPLGRSLNDLDIQRALANAVESGRIQHNDPEKVYVVVLDEDAEINVGGTTDFLSYNSVFHPTEMPMRYVVVRGGLDADTERSALNAGVAHAILNPNGNGWF